MKLVISLLVIAIILAIGLFVIVLPLYLIRRKLRPEEEKDTIGSLFLKYFLVALIFTLIMGSGIIAIYFDELRGIYR